MKDKIVTGTIENMETGEVHDIIPFYLFSNGCELNAIIKILSVCSSFNPDGEPARQITVNCLALDCQGNVFKLDLYFLPQCLSDEQKIISEITEGKIMVASGRYTILPKEETIITLYDPEYYPLPSEYSLEEVEEVFRANNGYDKNRLV